MTARAQYSKNKRIELVPHCRFVLHLPTSSIESDYRSQRCKYAATAVIERINEDYKASTFSSVNHSSFEGYWMDDNITPPQEHPSAIAILIVDIVSDFNDTTKVRYNLDKLRKTAYQEYNKSDAGQKEIWITVSPVLILMYTNKVIRRPRSKK